MLYKSIIRPLLFLIPPENAHDSITRLLEAMQSSSLLSGLVEAFCDYESRHLEQKLFGLSFKNPVGLAAGFDKDARIIKIMPKLGFGFIEIGTVTAQGQAGNPKPRIFRLPQDYALINRMGFNNDGADVIAKRLARLGHTAVPLGINLGKSSVELADAVEDYLYSFRMLNAYGDYFVVNVSSPNTPGLRQLQDKEPLDRLLQALSEESEKLAQQSNREAKPILVKIAPDLSWGQIDDIIEVSLRRKIAGLIATNTTIAREGLRTRSALAKEEGGLSGRPLTKVSTEIIRYIYKKAEGKLPLIGVGGVFNSFDAYEKIKAGASLIQVYTGLIYEGPFLIKRINRGLVKLMEMDGYKSIREVVGSSA